MSDAVESFGDFVVGCAPIVRREVDRLRRFGVKIPTDDGVQDGFLFLLENASALEGLSYGLARTIVRRRLINRYVSDPAAEWRGGKALAHVEIDHGDDDDDHGLNSWRVVKSPSFESDSIARLSLSQLEAIEPYPDDGTSRQAAQQARTRWIARMRAYVATGQHRRINCIRGHARSTHGYKSARGRQCCRACDAEDLAELRGGA